MPLRTTRALALAALALVAACGPGFTLKRYPQSPALFEASLRELKRRKWDNAVTGFERLTLDLAARDPMLPAAYWYLAQAHEGRGEHLLAAQNFARVAETFPEDTLADDALLEAGNSYARLWRKPGLDQQYGSSAQQQYRLLVSLYPDSPLRPRGEAALRRMDEWFATKDFDTGVFYVKRKAYDSALIYFRDVVRNFPETDKARQALLRMVQVYRVPVMNYQEDAKETCQTLQARWPDDREVVRLCGRASPTPADSTVRPAAP